MAREIDIQKEVFYVVVIMGFEALYAGVRLNKSTVPDGIYCYDL